MRSALVSVNDRAVMDHLTLRSASLAPWEFPKNQIILRSPVNHSVNSELEAEFQPGRRV